DKEVLAVRRESVVAVVHSLGIEEPAASGLLLHIVDRKIVGKIGRSIRRLAVFAVVMIAGGMRVADDAVERFHRLSSNGPLLGKIVVCDVAEVDNESDVILILVGGNPLGLVIVVLGIATTIFLCVGQRDDRERAVDERKRLNRRGRRRCFR